MKGIDINKYEVWIERTNLSPFTMSLFHFVEGPMTKDLIGTGFSDQICLIRDNKSYLIRLKDEVSNISQKHKIFIDSTSVEDLKKILEKALYVHDHADENIKAIEEVSDEEFKRDIDSYLKIISDILLYTTSITFFLLDAVDKQKIGGEKGMMIRKYCEKIRLDSKYPKLQKIIDYKIGNYFINNFGLNKEQAVNVSYDEFFKAIKNRVNFTKDVYLEKRSKLSLYWFDNEKSENYFSYDDELINLFLNNLIDIIVSTIREFTGHIANKGYAKGRVVIINHPSELGKVEYGDVVVSCNTNPSIMPALMKCTAIVTDEGGIACHAAIVSRELNKPCVIGTKIATKVLKDGDIVEVDADRGLIKILNI